MIWIDRTDPLLWPPKAVIWIDRTDPLLLVTKSSDLDLRGVSQNATLLWGRTSINRGFSPSVLRGVHELQDVSENVTLLWGGTYPLPLVTRGSDLDRPDCSTAFGHQKQ